MQRIPNPVSDLNIILRVYREIYEVLAGLQSFGLDDISRAMISKNNVTSQGAIGSEALARSTRDDRSRDPIYNQSKAYAELFRTFGWIQSTSTRLTYSFSLLGEYVALSNDPAALLRECLLGIAYPNEVLGVQSEQVVRVIGGILLTMDELSKISRDEVIAGPMSIQDDSNRATFKKMITEISKCREKIGALDAMIDEIAMRRQISKSPTMENYTRIPMASLLWSGWGERIGRKYIKITKAGSCVASRMRESIDFRLSNFNQLPDVAKPSFIRWTFYSMLKRAGFDLTPVSDIISAAKLILLAHKIKVDKDIYFSPFQQLSRETLATWTPELIQQVRPDGEAVSQVIEGNTLTFKAERARPRLIFSISDQLLEVSGPTAQLHSEIKAVIFNSSDLAQAVSKLVDKYKNDNKDIFYPLVANLFSLLGFDCRVSRGGQNYERADAIILDPVKSIPIEIKSPGEEALENKIIFLSRKGYPTDRESTSLVVGFNPPNERSEVHELIDNIWDAFGVRVGVVDFHSLMAMAVEAVSSGKKIDIKDFSLLKGVINA
jgi:hypothetical protein